MGETRMLHSIGFDSVSFGSKNSFVSFPILDETILLVRLIEFPSGFADRSNKEKNDRPRTASVFFWPSRRMRAAFA